MARSVALAALAAAACSYTPGAFHNSWHPFGATRATVGCLDIAIARYHSSGYTTGPVVDYDLGNRCDHRVPVDLASARVVVDGREVVPYDPRHELRVLPIVARVDGWERIEYRDPRDPSAGIPGEICVDIGGIDASQPRTERWLCTGGDR